MRELTSVELQAVAGGLAVVRLIPGIGGYVRTIAPGKTRVRPT
jgi:hypothetical protein